MAFTFEKLEVYQKAVTFADRVCVATETFSRGYGFLSDQLNRAALSIAANIAKGNGRFTKPDRKNFFGIARGGSEPMRKIVHCDWGPSVALRVNGRENDPKSPAESALPFIGARPCLAHTYHRMGI